LTVLLKTPKVFIEMVLIISTKFDGKKFNRPHAIFICDFLLKRNENDPFLKRIITDDEKWIVTSMWNEKDFGENDMSH